MKAVSREQALAVMAVLATNADLSQVDGDVLQNEVILKPEDAGKRFTEFLKNGAKVVIVIANFVLKLISAINPVEFIGKGWSVWRGPADGNGLKGDEDRDIREDGLSEIDWDKASFETCLKDDEPYITGEEKLLRLKAVNNIRLGGRAFISLWEDWQKNKENSVLEMLRKTRGITYLDFFGLVLRDPSGCRCVLCLYFDDGGWDWGYDWLGFGWLADGRSASLASVK